MVWDLGGTSDNKCKNCGQLLPEIMSCDEWKKAGQDLRRQIMQPGGLCKSAMIVMWSLRKKHWWSKKMIKTNVFTGEETEE
jgi:hypothetical protein